jgi:hypothetical protein
MIDPICQKMYTNTRAHSVRVAWTYNSFFAILHNLPWLFIYYRPTCCFLSDMLAESTVFTGNPVWSAEIECIYIDGLCVYDNFIFLK